jgi:hypothetical protein
VRAQWKEVIKTNKKLLQEPNEGYGAADGTFIREETERDMPRK